MDAKFIFNKPVTEADHNPQNWTYHLHIKEKLEDQGLNLEGHHKTGHPMKRTHFQHKLIMSHLSSRICTKKS